MNESEEFSELVDEIADFTQELRSTENKTIRAKIIRSLIRQRLPTIMARILPKMAGSDLPPIRGQYQKMESKMISTIAKELIQEDNSGKKKQQLDTNLNEEALLKRIETSIQDAIPQRYFNFLLISWSRCKKQNFLNMMVSLTLAVWNNEKGSHSFTIAITNYKKLIITPPKNTNKKKSCEPTLSFELRKADSSGVDVGANLIDLHSKLRFAYASFMEENNFLFVRMRMNSVHASYPTHIHGGGSATTANSVALPPPHDASAQPNEYTDHDGLYLPPSHGIHLPQSYNNRCDDLLKHQSLAAVLYQVVFGPLFQGYFYEGLNKIETIVQFMWNSMAKRQVKPTFLQHLFNMALAFPSMEDLPRHADELKKMMKQGEETKVVSYFERKGAVSPEALQHKVMTSYNFCSDVEKAFTIDTCRFWQGKQVQAEKERTFHGIRVAVFEAYFKGGSGYDTFAIVFPNRAKAGKRNKRSRATFEAEPNVVQPLPAAPVVPTNRYDPNIDLPTVNVATQPVPPAPIASHMAPVVPTNPPNPVTNATYEDMFQEPLPALSLRQLTYDEVKSEVSTALLVEAGEQLHVLHTAPMEIYLASNLYKHFHQRVTYPPGTFCPQLYTPETAQVTIPATGHTYLDRASDILSVVRPGSRFWSTQLYGDHLRADFTAIVNLVIDAKRSTSPTVEPTTRRRPARSSKSIEIGYRGDLEQLYGDQHFQSPDTDAAKASLARILDFMWLVTQDVQGELEKPPLGGNRERKSAFAQPLQGLLGANVMEYENVSVHHAIVSVPQLTNVFRHQDRKNDGCIYSYSKTAGFSVFLTGPDFPTSNVIHQLCIFGNMRGSCRDRLYPHLYLKDVVDDLTITIKSYRSYIQKVYRRFADLYLSAEAQSFRNNIDDLDDWCFHDGMDYETCTVSGSCLEQVYTGDNVIPKGAVLTRNGEEVTRDQLSHDDTFQISFYHDELTLPIGPNRIFSSSLLLNNIYAISDDLAMDQLIEVAFFSSFLAGGSCLNKLLDLMIEENDERLFGSNHPSLGISQKWFEMYSSIHSTANPRFSTSSNKIACLLRHCEGNQKPLEEICLVLLQFVDELNSYQGKESAEEIPMDQIEHAMTKVCNRINDLTRIEATGGQALDFSHFRLSQFLMVCAVTGVLKGGPHLNFIFIPCKGTASRKAVENAVERARNDRRKEPKVDGSGNTPATLESRHVDLIMSLFAEELNTPYLRGAMETELCESFDNRWLLKKDTFCKGQRVFRLTRTGVIQVKDFGRNKRWYAGKPCQRRFKFLKVDQENS